MPNVLFIILISFFTLCISFVSVKGTLTDLKYSKKWWKIITRKGQIAIVLTFVIIGLLIWQNNRTERRSDIKDAQLRKEREKSDSTITMGIKNGVDSNRKILFSDLSEALAKQNLRLDTVTKNLTAIKDSAKKVTIINSEDPNFDLCDIKPLPQTKDSMILKYFFCSENATSYDITVTLDILAKKNRLINTSHFIII